MSNWNRMTASAPRAVRTVAGYLRYPTLEDADDVLVPGRKVLFDGIQGSVMHIHQVDRERCLVAILEDGFSNYIGRFSPTQSIPTNVKVFRYRLVAKGNVLNVEVASSPIFRFNLREGAGY